MNSADKNALLVDAARWRLLGLLFERPRPGWHEEVRALASEVEDERFVEAARDAADIDEGRYLSVMGPGGAVSPREVGYRPMGDPGRILSELNGFYEAFGFDPEAEDPADHVAVEAGFVGFMKLKQAYAASRDDGVAERTAGGAVATFIDDHLSVFAGDLEHRLLRGGLPHLRRAASILREWCPAKSSPRLAVVGHPAPTPASDGDDAFTCGHE